jgi:hypothetical protein
MTEKALLYLRFKHKGKTYKYLAMPIGNNLKLILKYIREVLKIRIAWYMDDFLICLRNKEEAEKDTEVMLTVLTQLG